MVQFFDRTTPKMAFQNIKYWTAPEYNLTNNFNLAIMMEINNIFQFRDDLITIQAEYHNKVNLSYSITPISFIKCERSHYTENEEFFDKLGFDKALCLDMNNLSIQGNSVNDYFSYIQIKFLLCIDNDEDCMSKEQIESVFQSLKPMAYIYFMDTIFQTNNSRNRIKHFINYVDVNVTYHNAKENNIYFSNNEIERR